MRDKTILLVEDEALIGIAQKKTLEKYGYSVITATSGPKAIEKIHAVPGIDLILMDINLGNGKMDGTEAAEIILKEKDIPIVFLSSYTQPEILEKTEKITSYGYVVKDSGETVLNASIKMAFRLYEARCDLQRQKEVAKKGQDEYFNILNVSPVPLALFDESRAVSYLNPAFIRMFGYTLDDIPTIAAWWPRAYPDPHYRNEVIARWQANLEKVRKQGSRFEPIEVNLRCKDGTLRTVLVEAAALTTIPGMSVAIFYDITERKLIEEKLEEELTQRRIIFDQSPYGILTIDPETARFREFNTMAHRQLGYTREEFAELSVFDLEALETAEMTRERIADVMKSGERDFETIQRTKQGELRNIHVTARIIDVQGQPVYHCVWRDITEHKKAEEALKESQSRAKAMLETFPDLMFRMDSRGMLLDYKADKKDLYVQSEQDLIGEYIRDIMPPEFADLIERRITAALRFGIQTFEYQLPIPVRGMRDYEARIAPGGTDEVIAVVRDITERKKMDQALKASDERHTAILQTAMDGFCAADRQGRIEEVNDSYCRMSGYSRQELLAMNITDLEGSENNADVASHMERIMSHGEDRFEIRHQRKDGSIFDLEVSAQCRPIGNDQYWAFLRDITERKKAEKALQDSEKTLRAFFDAVHESLMLIDTGGTVLLTNSTGAERLGKAIPEIVGSCLFDHFPPDVRARRKGYFENVIATREPVYFEDTRDERSFEQYYQPLFTEDGTVAGITIFGHETTSRKKAEAALIKSEAKYRSVFENATEGIFQTTPDGKFISGNPALARFFGYGPTEDLVRDITNIDRQRYANPEDRRLFKDILEKTGMIKDFKVQLLRKDGSPVWASMNARAVKDDQGKIIYYEGTVEDITERKLAEEELRKSEEKFRSLYESINELAVLHEIIYDETGKASDYRILDCNRVFSDITGVSRDEAVGNLGSRIYDTGEAPYLPVYARVADTGEPARFDDYFAPLDKYFSISVSSPKKGCFVTISSDITERKQAEHQIRSLLAEKELLLQEVHHRIKNNMVTIMSLLSLQSDMLKDPGAISAFHDTRSRIRSMAVLYEKLYRSTDFRAVSAKEYLPVLVNEIVDNFPHRENIRIVTRVEDKVLDSKILSPLGIIINELITNAMKYAFNGIDSGKILVSFSIENEMATLVVEDNGIGIPGSIDMANPAGFGLQLVTILSEQLDGSLKVDEEKGTKFVLEFRV